MKRQFWSKVCSLVHSSWLLLTLALASQMVSIPARAQDNFQVDPQYSVAQLFLGTGQNTLEIALARISGEVVFDSNNSNPSIRLQITPDDAQRAEYAEMSFTSERFALTADGKMAVSGPLSVTCVERDVTMEPNEAYAGPQYDEPVAHTDTREVTLVVSDLRQQASHDETKELSGVTSVSRETFPQFVDAITASSWSTVLVDDEKCQESSTIGEDYSGATCTSDVVAKVTNNVVIVGTAGGEDYAGFRPIATPDRKQATMVFDLKLRELPSTAGVSSTATETSK